MKRQDLGFSGQQRTAPMLLRQDWQPLRPDPSGLQHHGAGVCQRPRFPDLLGSAFGGVIVGAFAGPARRSDFPRVLLITLRDVVAILVF